MYAYGMAPGPAVTEPMARDADESHVKSVAFAAILE